MSQFVNRQMLSHTKMHQDTSYKHNAYNKRHYKSSLCPLPHYQGEGTRAPGDKWDFGTTEMPSAPENTFCQTSFPSPEEEECMTDLWICKSADLSFLHGRPHRVTATMAASHYHDPRSMSRSSHYCTVHQNVHINVLPLSYLAVCRRRMVGV